MTVPPDQFRNQGGSAWSPSDPTSLSKSDNTGVSPDEPVAFDPYRFGAPEHPVPPEYAPPGYRPPTSGYPQPHPQAPPPHYAVRAYPPPRTGNGKAIAALVLGIASIVLCWLSLFDVVPVVLAVVFGVLGLNEAKSSPTQGGRGMALTGIICAAVGAVLAIVLTTWFVHLANECGGLDTNSTQLQQCVRNHI
jgi:hypothetical protein